MQKTTSKTPLTSTKTHIIFKLIKNMNKILIFKTIIQRKTQLKMHNHIYELKTDQILTNLIKNNQFFV